MTIVLLLFHSGMFPCFFGGREARLVRSALRALVDLGASLGRLDHRVDVAAVRGVVSVDDLVVVFGHEARPLCLDVAPRLRDGRERHDAGGC